MYPFLLAIAVCFFAYLAWRDLRLGLFLIAAALPSYLIRFSLLGLPTTLLEILIIILIAVWLVKKPALNLFRQYPKLLLPLGLLVAAATIGVFIAPDKTAALGIWKAYFIQPLLLFALALDILPDQKDQQQLIKYLGIGALFVALFALFQKITLWAIPAPWDAEGRITSLFPYPNAVGLYLGPIITLGFFSLLNNLKNKKQSVFWIIVLILSALAIIFAQTEAAYLAIPAAIVLTLIIFTKQRQAALAVSIIVIALLAAIPATRQVVWQKISFQDYSGTVRLAQWDETWQLLKDNFILGTGLSGYPQALKAYHTHPDIEIFQYPHNLLFNTWVELGLLGLLAGLLIIGWLAKELKTARVAENWIALAAFAAVMEMMIHGLVDVPYFKNDLAVLTWLILALLIQKPKKDTI